MRKPHFKISMSDYIFLESFVLEKDFPEKFFLLAIIPIHAAQKNR